MEEKHLEPEEVIEHLKHLPNGPSRVTELERLVDTYMGTRDRADGKVQEVTIQIFDRGPTAGSFRYHCEATTDDGKMASGNLVESIELALQTMSTWPNLD